jgi:hypothetical protein
VKFLSRLYFNTYGIIKMSNDNLRGIPMDKITTAED